MSTPAGPAPAQSRLAAALAPCPEGRLSTPTRRHAPPQHDAPHQQPVCMIMIYGHIIIRTMRLPVTRLPSRHHAHVFLGEARPIPRHAGNTRREFALHLHRELEQPIARVSLCSPALRVIKMKSKNTEIPGRSRRALEIPVVPGYPAAGLGTDVPSAICSTQCMGRHYRARECGYLGSGITGGDGSGSGWQGGCCQEATGRCAQCRQGQSQEP